MYHSDRPIDSVAEDRLERAGFSKHLAKAILELKTDETYTIGLMGKWGSGKTSLVNMTIEELCSLQQPKPTREKMTIIRFDPWNFSNTDQLISQFFVRLSGEFHALQDKDLSRIGDLLINYASAFRIAEKIPKHGKKIASYGEKGVMFLGNALKLFSKTGDVQKKKEDVIKELKKQKHRVLIVIDDIDRLPNEQIRQVFQLIASIAKFPNTTYLVTFDEDIVINALKEVQKGAGDEYLEKIIQIPVHLPTVRKTALHMMIISRFNEIIISNNVQFIERHWQEIFFRHVDPLIRSVRDLNRLFNTVSFKLSVISEETDFTDVVAISAIEVFLPRIYSWIKESKGLLTGKPADSDELQLRKKSKEDRKAKITNELQQQLDNSANEIDKNKNIASIMSFLCDLFPYFEQYLENGYVYDERLDIRKNNLIGHPEKFDRYFDLDINNINIRSIDIQQVMNLYDRSRLHDLLLSLDEAEESFSLLEEMEARLEDIPVSRVQEIARALVMVSSKMGKKNRSMPLGADSGRYAQNLVVDLIDHLPEDERIVFLNELIETASGAELASIAVVIDMMELGHGRLAARGVKKGYKCLISVEQLETIEKRFCDRVQIVLNTELLFDIPRWSWIFYLLKQFQAEYLQEYLDRVLTDDNNILKYLHDTVETWIGIENRYEVKPEYKKYLSQDRIITAISQQRDTGELFKLSHDTQQVCAAFYLNATEAENNGRIEERDADALLDKWKSKISPIN